MTATALEQSFSALGGATVLQGSIVHGLVIVLGVVVSPGAVAA